MFLLHYVVLYQWLEADRHGKSQETTNTTSGKNSLKMNGVLEIINFNLPHIPCECFLNFLDKIIGDICILFSHLHLNFHKDLTSSLEKTYLLV